MAPLTSSPQPNIVLVISDTFRKDYLGCYGHPTIQTPRLDQFAREAAIFEHAFPEGLPTIPVRRALFTGRRTYPFRDYRPVKWDIVSLPGWQPISNAEDTVAENLANAGYHTGFVSDTLPYFAPGFNFTRGFWQWEYIRGEQQDRWRSPYTATADQLVKYGDPAQLLAKGPRTYQDTMTLQHVANTAWIQSEQDTLTARVFRWAIQFIKDNAEANPFYLVVDAFKPHEPWEAFPQYYDLYKDPTYQGRTALHTRYGPIKGQYSDAEVDDIVANYKGLCTEVDYWFGQLVDQLKLSGLWESSLVIFTSDHGTNFGETPERIIGKPDYALFPAVMELPLLIHFPENHVSQEKCAGRRYHDFIYNVDIPATIYQASGLPTRNLSIHGQSLYAVVQPTREPSRPYLTSRYSSMLWYRDATQVIIFNILGLPFYYYRLDTDPRCMNNLVEDIDEEVAESAWKRVLDDAGGQIPDYSTFKTTDAIGQQETTD